MWNKAAAILTEFDYKVFYCHDVLRNSRFKTSSDALKKRLN